MKSTIRESFANAEWPQKMATGATHGYMAMAIRAIRPEVIGPFGQPALQKICAQYTLGSIFVLPLRNAAKNLIEKNRRSLRYLSRIKSM
jgi:hypothetical protein